MNAQKRLSVIRFVIVVAVLLVIGVTAHRDSGGNSLAQNKSCPCEKWNTCDAKPSPTKLPPGDPKKEPGKKQEPPKRGLPLKPVKLQSSGSNTASDKGGAQYMQVNPPVDDSNLAGINYGSGVAEDSEYNYEIGKANSSGHFAERRRYVYDTYRLAEAAHNNNEISDDRFNQATSILQERLKEINSEEQLAWRRAAEKQLEEDLKNRIEKENTKRTDDALGQIDDLDVSKFDEAVETISEVLMDNLAQSRALELMGQSGAKAFDRVKLIMKKLREKMAEDCDQKKVKVQDVMRVDRAAQLMGLGEDPTISRCFTRTIIAKAEFGGIQYEARRCIDISVNANRDALIGDWFVTISGPLSGSGHAQIGSGGSGTWAGRGNAGGAVITMNGPAQLISSPNGCALRLTSSIGVGDVGGYVGTATGVSGDLPIQLLNEPCISRDIKLP